MVRRSTYGQLAVALVGALGACAGAIGVQRAATPRAGVDELIAADRTFGAVAARGHPVAKITAMLDNAVMMPTPHGDFARTKTEAAATLRTALGPSWTDVAWAPIRGGISADGEQGFTFGYMTLSGPDTAGVPLKYLSYWVRGADGWRVAAYRVTRRAPGSVATTTMPPSLPAAWVRPTDDALTVARHRATLVAAERAFSDRAQVIGLGPAFVENGRPDAVNMGGRDAAAFVVGAEAIGKSVGGGSTEPGSPVSWSADTAIVASSGDLGVTFGFIRPNKVPEGDRPAGVPFFTVWRRDAPAGRWRYIAE